MVKVSFFGAAETVTGSKYHVESETPGRTTRFLIDCGLFQGGKELRLRNWAEPPFDISALDGILLTHAHIDHTGYLPLLVKRGYSRPIYCTPATKLLTELLLEDSARLQEEEANYANEVGSSRHHPAEPLYSTADAKAAIDLLTPIPRGEWSEPIPGVRVLPRCAGHILGACSLTIETGGKHLTFSGDIGRYNAPILPDPVPVEFGDLLVCESTYGDRHHAVEDSEAILLAALKRGLSRGGPIIIPAFALGRTQTLLFDIGKLEREGKIPEIPVYVDSPMAIDATEIYSKFHYDFDEESRKLIKLRENPLSTARTRYCKSSADSKKLNDLKGSRIIIAGSGMVNGGRVLHHLLHWLSHEETTVLFVGYQGEGTRGARIQRGDETIKIYGRHVQNRAQIETISGLSAHGDQGELTRWLKSSTGTPKHVRIVHGEPNSVATFSNHLNTEFGWSARGAKDKEVVEL